MSIQLYVATLFMLVAAQSPHKSESRWRRFCDSLTGKCRLIARVPWTRSSRGVTNGDLPRLAEERFAVDMTKATANSLHDAALVVGHGPNSNTDLVRVQGPTQTTPRLSRLTEEELLELAMSNSLDPTKQGQAYTIDYRPGRRGFHNLGNTCYFNALIQVLGHSTTFRTAIDKIDKSDIPKDSAAYSILRLIRRHIWSGTRFEPIRAKNFFARIQIDHPGLHEPEDVGDAMDLFMTIFNDLDRYSPEFGRLFAFPTSLGYICPNCRNLSHLIDSTVRVLQLPVPATTGTDRIRLFDCFQALLTPTKPIGPSCARCGTQTQQQILLGAPRQGVRRGPRLMFIQPTRQNIIKTPIEFPEHLDLSHIPKSYLTGQYRLVGVINLPQSHYTAQFWDAIRNEWVEANDRSVVTIGTVPLISTSVYALLYERVD
jgi:hypothetical protein